MSAPRRYSTALAFRTALETRLADRPRRDAIDLHRLRRQVAFDRLLARLFDPSRDHHDAWILKGGYALEMRFYRALSTKDLDLTVKRGQVPPGTHPHFENACSWPPPSTSRTSSSSSWAKRWPN